MKFQTSSELYNDSDYQALEINGLALRVNPEDILIVDKRNIESYPLIREDKAYTIASPFGRTSVNIVMDFDSENPVDVANLIKLCCYLDLYPFVFVKSRKIKEFTNTNYKLPSENQIFGVQSYELRTNADAQGVYFLTITLLYFNHVPFARNLTFYDVTQVTEAVLNPIKGDQGHEQEATKIMQTGPDNPILNGYFAQEIEKRLFEYYDFVEKNTEEYISLKMPRFLDTGDLGEYTDKQDFIVTELESSNDPTASRDTDKAPALKSKKYTIGWSPIANPTNLVNRGSKQLYNLNAGQIKVAGITITKANNFVSHNLAGWVHPVLQYLGRGSTDISIQFNAVDRASEADTPLAIIKTLLQTVDANFNVERRLNIYNVIKMDSLLTTMLPVWGMSLDNQATRLSSDDQGQGVAVLNVNLMENDNRNRLTNSDSEAIASGYKSSGAKEGIDLNQIEKNFMDLIQKIGAKPDAAPPPRVPGSTNKRPPTGPDGKSLGQDYLTYLNELEDQYGLPRDLLYNQMMAESAGKGTAQSYDYIRDANGKVAKDANGKPIGRDKNKPLAAGLFQFIPGTAKQFGIDPRDPRQAARAAAQYNAQNIKSFGLALGIAAYNTGPGNVRKNGEFVLNPSYAYGETAGYVNKILAGMNGSKIYNLNSSTAGHREIELVLERTQSALLDALPSYGYGTKNKTQFIPLSLYIKNSKSLNTGFEQAKYKQIMENAQIAILKLAQSGNPLAQAVIYSEGQTVAEQVAALDDKFRTEGVPDLHFKDRIGSQISQFGITDIREIPPFYFLLAQPYFSPKQIRAVTSQVVPLFSSEPPENAVTERIRIVRDSLDDDEKVADYRTAFIKNKESDYSDVKLAKDKQNKLMFNEGDDEVDPSEETQSGEDTFFKAPTEDIDPFSIQDIVQKQNESIGSYFRHGLNLAFPVVKAFIVEGDETTVGNYFNELQHSYYELNGLMDLRVATSSEDNPVDVLTLTIANPSNCYTDKSTTLEKYKPKTNFDLRNTESENSFPLNELVIKPGNRLIVKAGYGNNVNTMETIFNGVITETGGEYLLNVVAEGFGRELIAVEHGDDPEQDNGFLMNANTESIIINALNSEEIEHFGSFKVGFETDPDAKTMRRMAAGIFGFWKATLKFSNLWFDPIADTDNEFNSSFLENLSGFFSLTKNAWYQYPIFRLTPYDMLKEMEYRHPGVLSRPANYDDRSTYFFGQKEQLYLANSVDPRILNMTTGEKFGAVAGGYISGIGSIGSTVAGGAISTVTGGLIDARDLRNAAAGVAGRFFDKYDGGDLYRKSRASRFKPISEYHVLTSDHNIISNRLMLSEDFSTVVTVQYSNQEPAQRDTEFDTFEVKIDDNLRPSAHREMSLSMPGCIDEVTAARYGAVAIKKEAERMYDGTITILGNPRIKAGDYLTINDNFRAMEGILKVRECTHAFSMDEGFVTVITPGLYVDTSFVEYPLAKTFPALHTSMMLLSTAERTKSKREAVGDKDFLNYNSFMSNTGDPNSLKELGGNVVLFGANAGLLYYLAKGGFQAGGKVFGAIGKFAIERSAVAASAATTGAKVAGIGAGIVESSLMLGRGLWAASLPFRVIGGALATAAVTIVYENIFATYFRKQKVRQPVKLYPIKINGLPATAGIYGYAIQGPVDAVLANLSQTGADLSVVFNAITAGSGQTN